MKQWVRSMAVTATCIAFLAGCVGLEAICDNAGKPVAGLTNPMEKDSYNGAGLMQGQKLSQKVIYDGPNLVCYEDRALHKFYYKTKHSQAAAKQIHRFINACPALENIYVMPVTPRICTEEGYDEEKAAYAKFCEELDERLPQKATLVDALTKLREHRDEYVFYRTEDSWTARGAYYGMEALCEKMDLPLIPFGEYEEAMYNSFTGSIKYLDDEWEMKDISFPVDWTYYYMLPDSVNRVEITRFDENGQIIHYKKPLITISARNDGTFIDVSYIRAIADGKARNKTKQGQYVLVICDEKGKLLVPYLKDYYDGVYVVNVREDGDFAQDVDAMIRTYHITDAVFAQNACDMGVDGYDRAWQGFEP